MCLLCVLSVLQVFLNFCDLFSLQPQQISMTSLDAFCQDIGIFAQFVPAGVDLIPPNKNVDHFGLRDPTLRTKQQHLDYIFAMEETDILEMEGTLEAVGSWD